MDEESNTAVVRGIYEAFLRDDLPAVLDSLADDVEWTWYGPSDIPFAGTHHGREGVSNWFSVIAETIEFEQWEPREFVAQGDTVVVLGFERDTVKSTGRTFDQQWVQFFTLTNGKITRFRQFPDTAAVAAAFESD